MTRLVITGLALAIATPAFAQHDHAGHDPAAAPVAPPTAQPDANDPHAGHAMPIPKAEIGQPAQADPHAGHDMSAMPSASDEENGNAPAPAPPEDHAADAIFGSSQMAPSRADLQRGHGAFSGSMILFDLAEIQVGKGGDGFRWEAEAWFGGDIDKLLIKTEGEGTFGEPIEEAEAQVLYSRAIAPYWNIHTGIRHDFRPDPSRTYAVLGIEGVAPYWFHATGQLFLSDKGDLRVRAEGSYDQHITQKLLLTPRLELNLSAQDMPQIGVGAGLTDLELGLRLRYETKREFAPYIGVEWSRKFGATARYARAAGEEPGATSLLAGIRFWF